MGSVLHVDRNSFQKVVLDSSLPVLVDFWAAWCGPCRSLGPILDDVAKEVGAKALVVKVDIDVEENGELAQQYGIRGIPTMIFFKNGEATKTLVGLQPKAELVKSLEELS